MMRAAAAVAALVMTIQQAAADEFTDVVESALAAYRDGDVAGAQADIEYAAKLLLDMKAEALATFLPAAPAGWSKEAADTEGAGVAMAMFGGGTTAAATYRRGSEEMTLTLMANSPMVSGIGAMVSGMGSVAGGETVRIQRTQFAVTDGEMQGVVDEKVLVTVGGSAALEDKTALVEAMDLRALGAY